MFTLLIILFVVIAIIKASKKDKHNVQEDLYAMARLPSFVINAKPMNTFSKIINLAVDKSELLKTFSYSNGRISIVTENGRILSAQLKDIFVDFDKQNGVITYTIKAPNQKIKFYKTTNISNMEWDAINSVLCLAGSTRGRNLFSKEAKYVGFVNVALKAINALS